VPRLRRDGSPLLPPRVRKMQTRLTKLTPRRTDARALCRNCSERDGIHRWWRRFDEAVGRKDCPCARIIFSVSRSRLRQARRFLFSPSPNQSRTLDSQGSSTFTSMPKVALFIVKATTFSHQSGCDAVRTNFGSPESRVFRLVS